MVSPVALEQVPVGSSKDQVLIALGSPSTTANYGNDVFYYISQTRQRAAAFMAEKVVDQRIVAVYFNNKDQVDHVANYGLQDGKVFDFISRTTPTGGGPELPAAGAVWRRRLRRSEVALATAVAEVPVRGRDT